MPKKTTHKRTFREWFFGTQKKENVLSEKRTQQKPGKKSTVKKTNNVKSSSPKKKQPENLTVQRHSVDVQKYISDAVDRLPRELASKQEVTSLSPELAKKHEQLKRKHLHIGVVAFTTLIGILWLWNMVMSMGQLADTSSQSVKGLQQKAAVINQEVTRTLDDQAK